MSDPLKFPSATGITGLVSRLLGVHPIIAAGIKYLAMAGIVFGAYKVWEARIEKGIVQDIVIEEQDQAIEDQKDAMDDFNEDVESRNDHVDNSANRETEFYEQFLSDQAERIARLEKANEELKKVVDGRPDLRKPWPDRMQRRGGADLNRENENTSSDTGTDRGGNPD